MAVAPRTLFLDEANRNLHGTGGTTRRVPEAQGAPWAFVWCGLVLMLEQWCSISGAVPAPRRPSRRPGAAHLHRLNRRHCGSAASRSHEIKTIARRRGRVRFSRRAILRQSMTGPRTVGSRQLQARRIQTKRASLSTTRARSPVSACGRLWRQTRAAIARIGPPAPCSGRDSR